jgi:hypothetical protein
MGHPMTDRGLEGLPDRSVAMVRAFSPALDRALLVGGAIAVVVAILLMPFIAGRLPSAVAALEPLLTALVAAVLGILAALTTFPGNVRRAFEAYSWLGRTEMDRFAQRTGGPVPVKPPDIERWLAATPSTPATRLARIEVLAFVGRRDEARAELATIESGSAEDAFELASLRQYIDWLDGGPLDTAELASAAARLPAGSTDRSMGDVNVALAEARERSIRHDPAWFVPLEMVRTGLGRAPSIVAVRDTWLKLAVMFFVLALAVAIGVLLLR